MGKTVDDPELVHVLDQRYLETEVAINGHTASYHAVDSAFRAMIRQTRGAPQPSQDQLEPIEVRFDRTVRTLTQMLPGAGLTLGDWTDLLEFHEVGEQNAARLRHLYDWMSNHPEILASASAAGLLDDTCPIRETDRVEAEITGIVRRFWRGCSEAARRRGHPQFLALGMAGVGVSLYSEESPSNRRSIEPFRPTGVQHTN